MCVGRGGGGGLDRRSKYYVLVASYEKAQPGMQELSFSNLFSIVKVCLGQQLKLLVILHISNLDQHTYLKV